MYTICIGSNTDGHEIPNQDTKTDIAGVSQWGDNKKLTRRQQPRPTLKKIKTENTQF